MIDDDEEDALIVQGFLEEKVKGLFEIKQVSRMEQLSEIAKQEHDFNIVLTEYAFQDFTGYQVIQFIRNLRPRIPFIFLTDWPHLGIDMEAVATAFGASGFLDKSEINCNLLLEKIQAAIENSYHK